MQRNNESNRSTMQVYWRSDTRPPAEIFAEGFRSHYPTHELKWWEHGLNVMSAPHLPSDANPHVVALSTNLFSAPIFPTRRANKQDEQSESYLYAVLLPTAVKMDTNNKLDESGIGILNFNNAVIDLHSHQVLKTAETLAVHKALYDAHPSLALEVGWALYAYEVMVKQVDVSSIICAVKIIREKQQVEPLTQKLGKLETGNMFCNFKIEPEIYTNPTYNQQVLADSQESYKKMQLEVMTRLLGLTNQCLSTPRAKDGLGGKTFANYSGADLGAPQVYPPVRKSPLSLFGIISDLLNSRVQRTVTVVEVEEESDQNEKANKSTRSF